MEIQTSHRGAVLVVRPSGPLTGPDADTFKTAIQGFVRDNLGRVIIDASGLPYVDSKGLECLADIAEELALERQGPETLCGQRHAAPGDRADRSGRRNSSTLKTPTRR